MQKPESYTIIWFDEFSPSFWGFIEFLGILIFCKIYGKSCKLKRLAKFAKNLAQNQIYGSSCENFWFLKFFWNFEISEDNFD